MGSMKNLVALFVLFLCVISCQPLRFGRDIQVVSIAKEIDKGSPDYEICRSLILTKEDVKAYFSIAEEVNEYEFNHEAIILPCKYRGTIRIHGDLLQWEIYAGGAGYLYDNNSINKRYLCKGKCCDVLPDLL